MSDEQKRSQAWNEEVAYVDCPVCEETIEIGSGLVFSAPVEWECPRCMSRFLVEAPE